VPRAALIYLGTLTRPHGLKGEMRVDWYADSPFPEDAPLWIGPDRESAKPARVIARREHQGQPLLRFDGITDRTAAEALRGSKLFVDRDFLPPLEEDEAYVEDMLNANVLLPDGRRLGRFERLECLAGQDIWVIVTDRGEEILFPAQPCFILGFDDARRIVRIDPPPGLMEVYVGG
jgi:16S rRNA processing protein RimM